MREIKYQGESSGYEGQNLKLLFYYYVETCQFYPH